MTKTKVSLFTSILGRRVLRLTLLYGILLVIIVTTLQLFLEYQRDTQQIHLRIDEIYKTNADSLANSLWSLDREHISSQLKGILQIPDIRQIKIISNDLEPIILGEAPNDEGIIRKFDLQYVVTNETVQLGNLYISADYSAVYQRLWQKGWLILVGSLFIVTFVSGLMLTIMSIFVTRPLIELATFFQAPKSDKLHQSIKITRTVTKQGGDEIDVLLTAINQMMSELKHTHDTLEQQVKERTYELQLERNLFIAGNVVVFKWINKDGWPVEYVSPNVADVFGYTAEDFISRKIQYSDLIPEEEIDRVAREVTSATENAEKHFTHQPYRIIRKDGRLIWLDDFSTILRDETGNITHYLGYVVDITSRKKAEEVIVQAKNEAVKANHAKSDFLSSMSHELRTPMNAILGFSQLIEVSATDKQTKHNIEHVIKAGNHLLTLINEVLDLSKIESGTLDLSLEDASLNKILEESFTLIYPLAEKHDIQIIDNISKQSNHCIHVDYTRFKQVLLNLLSNAVKYNHPGGNITIKCTSPSPQRLRISVLDTGTGLNKEQQKHLFIPFERVGAETTEIEGTGIGLVITKQLIEMMGGSIGVESQAGIGSDFWVEVNLIKETKPSIAITTSKDEQSIESETTSVPAKTILYIEDNPINQILIEQIVESLTPHTLILAADAALGLELAKTQSPALILLDINLPGMDGYEALKHLKANEETQHIPVVALSANAMKSDLKKGQTAGFLDYLTKPIDIKQVVSVINKILK